MRHRLSCFLLLLLSQLATAGTPDASWTSYGWNGRGCAGNVNAAVELEDGTVLLGGYFNACGNVDASGLIRYHPDTNHFSALANTADFRGPVRALVRSGQMLYVGGGAMQIPGYAEPSIFASLNLASGQWFAPADTPQQSDTSIIAIAEVLGQMYVATQFGNPGLLRFDPGTGAWIDLGHAQED